MPAVALTFVRHGKGDKVVEYAPGETLSGLSDEEVEEAIAAGSAVKVSKKVVVKEGTPLTTVRDNVLRASKGIETDDASSAEKVSQLEQELAAAQAELAQLRAATTTPPPDATPPTTEGNVATATGSKK